VEQCDIYIIILAERYGFTDDKGTSVTETEYETAKATGKPILAFVKHGEMEPRQVTFRKKVEHYSSGLFRAACTTPSELKDEIIRALRNLEQMYQAASEAAFDDRIKNSLEDLRGRWNGEPEIVIALWPQPVRTLDVVLLEAELDQKFEVMARVGLVSLRDGYKVDKGRTWTGLSSKKTRIAWFDDGLILLLGAATVVAADDYGFSNCYVSPIRIKDIAIATSSIAQANGAWCHIGLRHMGHAKVVEPPRQRVTSVTLRSSGPTEDQVSELLIPFTGARYEELLGRAVRRFQRTFT
jgi:hypothetical protein